MNPQPDQSKKSGDKFEIITIMMQADGTYFIDVKKKRPLNSPSWRHTEADRKRRQKAADENMRLLEAQTSYTLQEVVDYIEANPEA